MLMNFFQVQRAQGETEQRQLLDELDASKARINQLERQATTKQDTITMLQNHISTYENKIHMLEKETGDKTSQVELNRRQNERLAGEIDQAKIDNSSLRQENEYTENNTETQVSIFMALYFSL
jgi:chromosome segregation ATPase